MSMISIFFSFLVLLFVVAFGFLFFCLVLTLLLKLHQS